MDSSSDSGELCYLLGIFSIKSDVSLGYSDDEVEEHVPCDGKDPSRVLFVRLQPKVCASLSITFLARESTYVQLIFFFTFQIWLIRRHHMY